MLIDKKKIFLVLAFCFLLLLCLALIIALAVPSSSKDDKEMAEICILRECLEISEAKKTESVTASICMPKNCASLADFLDYGRVCILVRCVLEGVESVNGSNTICMSRSCITSDVRAEELKNDDVCMEGDCISTASEILDMMNEIVDPCDNFYQFSCGGMKNSAAKEPSKSSVQLLAVENVMSNVREILEDPSLTKTWKSLDLAQSVYKTCMIEYETHNHEKSILQLKDLFTEEAIGLWPTLELSWNSCQLDLESQMAKLNAYGVDSFFKLVPEFKGINNTLSASIYVADPLIDGICNVSYETIDGNFTDLDVTREHTDALIRALELLDSHENLTESDVEELLQFDYKFCNVTQSSRRKKKTYEISELTLQDLIFTEPEINWSRWHKLFFEELGLSSRLDEMPIYVYHLEESLHDLVQLITKTPPRTIANYLSWKFVLHHLGFLSKPFSHAFDKHPSSSGSYKYFMEIGSHNLRWKQCVKYVQNMMPLALIPPLASQTLHPGLKIEMEDIITDIRKKFNQTMNETSELMYKERRKSSKKINGLKIFLLGTENNSSHIEDFYNEAGISRSSSFLQKGLALRRFQLKKLFDGIANEINASSIEYFIALHNPFSLGSWNDFRGNKIVLSFVSIEKSGLSTKRQKYLNFGAFGTLVGSEIAKGFDFASLSEEPRLHSFPKNWTHWPYYAVYFAAERNQCFEKSYLSHKGTSENLALVVDNIAADNAGIIMAFKAYKEHVKTYGRGSNLPGLNFLDEHLFFIKYAQGWCSAESKSIHELRVNVALSNAKVFSEVFKCMKGKHMNPSHKCKNF